PGNQPDRALSADSENSAGHDGARRIDYQCDERRRIHRLSGLGRVWHLEVWPGGNVADLGGGAGRDGNSCELGGSGEYEYSDAPRGEAGESTVARGGRAGSVA